MTVPVNLREWKPNVSHKSVSGETADQWRASDDAGRSDLLKGNHASAIEHLEKAARLDPIHAETRFDLGRAYEGKGEHRRAIQNFRLAVDLDHNPFRAISDFNTSIRQIAAKYPNATLVDAEITFARASAPYAPGFDMFLDYVHPSKRGNLAIAEDVFDAIVDLALYGRSPSEPKFSHVEESANEEGEFYDELSDYNLQKRLLSLYTMMHQYESLVEKASQYAEGAPKEIPRALEIMQVFPDYVALKRRLLLGEIVPGSEVKLIKQRVVDYYESSYKRLGDLPLPKENIF